jgi:hypothetical protein
MRSPRLGFGEPVKSSELLVYEIQSFRAAPAAIHL